MPAETWQRPPSIIHKGWRYTIRTSHSRQEDVVDADVPAIRDVAVAAIKASRDYLDESATAHDELVAIVEELETVTTADDFDDAMVELYDWADGYRVIIHGGPD